MLYSMCKLNVEREPLCALEKGRTGSGPRLYLFVSLRVKCCLSVLAALVPPLFCPTAGERVQRGQLRKRAYVERNKPVIARDSAYSAKSITMPVNLLSILLASSSQFRFRTFQRTKAECK